MRMRQLSFSHNCTQSKLRSVVGERMSNWQREIAAGLVENTAALGQGMAHHPPHSFPSSSSGWTNTGLPQKQPPLREPAIHRQQVVEHQRPGIISHTHEQLHNQKPRSLPMLVWAMMSLPASAGRAAYSPRVPYSRRPGRYSYSLSLPVAAGQGRCTHWPSLYCANDKHSRQIIIHCQTLQRTRLTINLPGLPTLKWEVHVGRHWNRTHSNILSDILSINKATTT